MVPTSSSSAITMSICSPFAIPSRKTKVYGTFKFPETFIIDRNGKIVRKFIGATDWTSPDIVDYLNKL